LTDPKNEWAYLLSALSKEDEEKERGAWCASIYQNVLTGVKVYEEAFSCCWWQRGSFLAIAWCLAVEGPLTEVGMVETEAYLSL
jgi:hypothetical protein